MRRSRAPSTKTNPNFSSVGNETLQHSMTTNAPDNIIERRSTESVLSLLSGFNDEIINPDEICMDSEVKKSQVNSDLNNITETVELGKALQTDSPPSSCLRVFNVVYGKQTKKKHKTWEGDGKLEVGSKYLTLRDENGKIIGRGPCPKARKLEEGERFYLGKNEVELLELASDYVHKSEKSTLENATSGSNERSYSLTGMAKKPLVHCKRFQTPRSCYSSGMALPDPNAEHQWHFNQNGLPLSPVFIEEGLSKKLRPHQCEGVTFLYECIMGFKDVRLTGAILADEMGLGKTLQCIALIWTLLKQGPYGNVPVVTKTLIVAPSSLTNSWYNEFLKWLGRVKILPFVITPKNKASDFRGPVMIVSYEMLVRCIEDIESHRFDLLICDEGHRLKNSNIKTTQMLNRLQCPRRIILTGTPLQNDLNEFYSLVDFVNPNILGSPSQFRAEFADAILASRQPNASETALARGRESAQTLKKITSKFLLRRTRDILKNYLPPRHDVVVFCKVTHDQALRYNSFVDSLYGAKKCSSSFLDGSSYLEYITNLKKICNHPSLVNKDKIDEVPVIEKSGKAIVTINFLRELQSNSPKEKVVLVSNSTQTLDFLEKIFRIHNFPTCRLDGSTPLAQRNRIVERFNGSHASSGSSCSSSSSAFVFLLSSKAGGVGLNVTGASRLLLYDSDWNPATDLQAISRIWRDGQKYPVYIYRLLTAGTIEEKIYQRQLSKLGLCEGTVDPENNKSIKLSSEELKDLFFPCQANDDDDCLTHDALSCDCTKQGETPVPEMEEEERSCQLMKFPKAALKISELFHWEHHGRPFNPDFLSPLCLESSKDDISFIFYN